VIRTQLRYHAPDTLEEACRILAQADGGGAVLGGGTMLIPRMVRGETSVSDAVHIRRLGLGAVEAAGAGVRIGAAVTYSDVLSLQRGTVPDLLTKMAGGITGGPQIRNQGTLAGSACFANPTSDVPACLVALDAVLHVEGARGRRDVAALDFFVGPFRTSLGRDEVLTSIEVPDVTVRSGYWKLKLSESSWPIATAAAVAHQRPDRSWGYRLALGAVSGAPVLIDLDGLIDETGRLAPDRPGAGQVLRAAVNDPLVEPWADELAPAGYRRQVAPAVASRALLMLQKELGA
jgi:carbon-monoxide dehydrogenase medium subunit